MKKVLLTTSAIVGLTAPAFAADPTAVSDQPYFTTHPMTWSGSMSISLTNLSEKDADDAILKSHKKNFVFSDLFGDGADEVITKKCCWSYWEAGSRLRKRLASEMLSNAVSNLAANVAHLTAADFTALEDIVDDYFGGSYSNAFDVMLEATVMGSLVVLIMQTCQLTLMLSQLKMRF